MLKDNKQQIKNLDLPLQRDLFLRSLIRELAGTLQDLVGQEEANGYISIVGQNMGEWINQTYKDSLNLDKLDATQVAAVLIDLKARINGNFQLLEYSQEKMVFTNDRCPFEDKVLDRPCMCMMTSNVFGSITADNLGYAKVELKKTIANRDGECHVTVYTSRTEESEAAEGREYFGLDD